MKSNIFASLIAGAAVQVYGFSTTAPFARLHMSQNEGSKSKLSMADDDSSFEIPAGKATAIAMGAVNAPIDDVWEVMKDFDKLHVWWPIYDNFSATGDSIGDTRTFGFIPDLKNPMITTEKLLFNGATGDGGYRTAYNLVSMENSPVVIDGVTTVITLTPDGDTTNISWKSWTDSRFVSLLSERQVKGYEGGISALNKYINPSLGLLDVDIISAKNIGEDMFLRPRARVAIDGADAVTISSNQWGSNPSFETNPTHFDITKPSSKLDIIVYASKIGTDDIIGTAEVDISKELKNGEVKTIELPLEGTDDATITVELELTLSEGGKLPLSPVQQKLLKLQMMEDSLDSFKKKALMIQKLATMPEPAIWEWQDAKNGLPNYVKGLPASEVLPPHKIGSMIETISEYAFTQLSLPKKLLPVANKYERYAAYFAAEGEGYVPIPDILVNNLWAEDEEFLRQIFSGLNPMQVKVCTSSDGLPKQFDSLNSEDGKSVDELIADDRLYILDYAELRDFELEKNGKLYAPTVLIYRTGEKQLDILGIVLDPRDADAPVYTPNSDTPNKYLLAKLHVACADNQVHQFPYHLGYAHLGTEPVVVAAHNSLGYANHPLYSFLKPHFRGTVGINYLARQTLVAEEDAITDKTFAVGTQQGVEMTAEKFKDYDFMEIGLPGEMKRRGFERSDEFKGYRYRDDGWLIWDTLWLYCEDMVNALYETDEDVSNDKVLQEWATESSSAEKGAIQGFPTSFTDKVVLTKSLTTIIWCTSALHSALNYVQYPYTATPINRPAAIFKGVPTGPEDVTEDYILSAIPGGPDPTSAKLSLFQGLLSWLLASPEPPVLTEVSDRIPNKNNPIELIEFRSKYIDVYNNFDSNLKAVEKIIDDRNKGMKMPYCVLKPSQIAASINI